MTPGTLKRSYSNKIMYVARHEPHLSSQTTFTNSPYRLTCQAFLIYSCRVKAEFESLEHKLAQLVQLYQRLRAENHELRQALAESQSDQRQCSDKVDQAKSRLEKLLDQIPEDV
jgi:cell division protein ZapB